jgi:nucleotide-binding universal stress UspA family protein
VYVVRETEDHEGAPAFKQLLVPLDGSSLAESALDTAVEIADRTGASITLAQVPTVPAYVTTIPETSGWIPGYLREQAESANLYLQGIASALAESGVESSIDVEVVRAGGVADGILASAAEHGADLIVMSTHGRTGFGRWLFGSVADRVLRGAELPVWLVRAHETDQSD